MPNNPLALELIKSSGLPLAAPSANKFGHVSPSRAEHVYNDFYKDSEVAILDGGPCNYGIESTVLKLELEGDNKLKLIILRKGGVPEQVLRQALEDMKLEFSIQAKKHNEFKPETENLEGPGQFLRHYSPNIESFLFTNVSETNA